MAVSYDIIEDENVRRWFEKNIDANFFNKLYKEAIKREYEFDPKSGMFFRMPFPSELLEEIGRTYIEIVSCRPTDMHYHEDIDEHFFVVNGEGNIYKNGKITPFRRKDVFSVKKGVIHYIEPKDGSILEVKLICSGIYNPSKEKVVKRFYELE